MGKKKFYQKAYDFLDAVTPLDYDCGSLCEGACCQGESRRGMYLFPGEEAMFPEKKDAWYTLNDTSLVLEKGYRIKLLTCRGDCPRDERPLSCRLFPLMPYLTKEELVELRLDPKSIMLCPLAREPEKYSMDDAFVDGAYDALEVLVEDDEVLEFISLLSDDYDAMNRLL